MPEETSPASTLSVDEATESQFDEVYRAEIECIERRRRAVEQKTGKLDAKPTVANELVGLAFSGGGIRSATFNLGVLQALRRWGLFKHVDLLSTVSGGGFIGSCLTSLMRGRAGFPFDGETPAVQHLRNNSNYLAPSGLLDYLRMFAVLIRGIILNFLVLAPLLLIPCLIATLLYGPRLLSRLEYEETVQHTIDLLSTAVTVPPIVVVEKGKEVKPLLTRLKKWGFLPSHVADRDSVVKAALREARPEYRDVTKPLITSGGGEDAPPVFLRGVDLSDVAHRLLDAELLVPPETLEEIYVVESRIREGLEERQLSHFLDQLENPPSLPQRYFASLTSPEPTLFKPFVTRATIVETLAAAGMVRKPGGGSCVSRRPTRSSPDEVQFEVSKDCEFTRQADGSYRYTLTQVLLTLYENGLYDRRALDNYLRSAGFDREAVYPWPRDERTYLEIEAATLELWKILGGEVRSVEELFKKLESSGKEMTRAPSKKKTPSTKESQRKSSKPLLLKGRSKSGLKDLARRREKEKNAAPLLVDFTAEENKERLLLVLKKTGVVGPVDLRQPKDCASFNLAACRFTEARSTSRLPEILYKSHLFNQNWFRQHQRSRSGELPQLFGLEPRARVRYVGQATEPEEIEIEAASQELDLRPGPVAEIFERLKELQDTPKESGVVALIDPALDLDDLGLQTPTSLREALELEALIRCDRQEIDTCSLASIDSLDAIPRLLYDLRLFNEEWFRGYFGDKANIDPLTRLSERVELTDKQKTTAEEILFEGLRSVVEQKFNPKIVEADIKRRIQELLTAKQREELEKASEIWSVRMRQFLDSQVVPHRVRYRQPWKVAKERIQKAIGKSVDPSAEKEKLEGGRVALKTVTGTKRTKAASGRGITVEEFFEALAVEETDLLAPQRTPGWLFGKLLKERLLEGKDCKRLFQTDEEAVSKSAAGCSFTEEPDTQGIDRAIRWSMARGYLTVGESSPSAQFNSWRNQTRRFYSRHLVPYLEQILWSPKDLRVPLTVFAALIGLTWVLLFPYVNLALRNLKRDKFRRRDLFERSFSLFMLGIASVAFFEIQPYLIYHWHYLKLGADWSLVIAAASVISAIIAGPALSFFRKFGRMIVLVVVSLLGPLLPFLLYLTLLNQIIYSESWLMRDGYELNRVYVLLFFAAAFLIFHLFLLTLDPNSTGMHGFYKDRLARAYLLARGEDGGVVPDCDLKLSKIGGDDSRAPYHLVNVTLNLQASHDASLRDRSSDFFVFSRLWVGGGRNVGYCPTSDMETVLPRLSQLSLGTATAVSGAAAAPNMGALTLGPLVILLALLNIRLGYWIPNPRSVRRWAAEPGRLKRALGLYRLRPGAHLFLREVFGRIDDRRRCVNVSDGGHLENTAIFELLRRRCRFIIAGDAEEDPDLNFSGLAALQRFARLDLNTELKIDPSRMRAVGTKRCVRHFVVGEILYPKTDTLPAETGYLIYLKASLTGDESQIVTEYAAREPLFPHESTGDQFFSERQFEAYRDLGNHVVDDFFAELDREIPVEGVVLEWLDSFGSMASLKRQKKEPLA